MSERIKDQIIFLKINELLLFHLFILYSTTEKSTLSELLDYLSIGHNDLRMYTVVPYVKRFYSKSNRCVTVFVEVFVVSCVLFSLSLYFTLIECQFYNYRYG